MTISRLAKIIALLFKSFEKEEDEELAEIYYNILKEHDLNKVEASIKKRIESSPFFPRISDILSYKSDQDEIAAQDFLLRFRKQAPSPYSFTKMDDDVFTAKRYLVPSIVEATHAKDWPWLEKRALSIFQRIYDGHINVLENPYMNQVSSLSSGKGEIK